MITDIASYLRFFDGVRRRTERDVVVLPPAAAAWRPPTLEGEAGWSIGQIVAHIGVTRLYFASAYRGEGWIWRWPRWIRRTQETWAAWSRDRRRATTRCCARPPRHGSLVVSTRSDTPGATLSGWRLLMMMLEHQAHHRSQIDAYAGFRVGRCPHLQSLGGIDRRPPGRPARMPRSLTRSACARGGDLSVPSALTVGCTTRALAIRRPGSSPDRGVSRRWRRCRDSRGRSLREKRGGRFRECPTVCQAPGPPGPFVNVSRGHAAIDRPGAPALWRHSP